MKLLHTISARLLLPLLLTLATLPTLSTAQAAGHAPREHAPKAIVLAQSEVSLDAAVAMVRQRYGGKVISAKTVGKPGNRVHVIKVLSDEGRVRTVRVDAQSGRFR